MVGVVPARGRAKAQPEPESRPNLGELRRQAGQAVVAWQAQLVALHLGGHPNARAGLRPTDDYRDKVATTGTKAPPDPKTPGGPTPTPVAPPAPPLACLTAAASTGVKALLRTHRASALGTPQPRDGKGEPAARGTGRRTSECERGCAFLQAR